MLFHKKGGHSKNRVRICEKGLAYLPANYAFFICGDILNCSHCYMNGDIPECGADEKSRFHWKDVKGHGVLGLFKEEEL